MGALALPAALALLGIATLTLFYTVIKPALFLTILAAMALVLFYGCLNDRARHAMGRAPILLALCLPPLAWLLPSIWLLYAAMLLVVPLTARRARHVAPLYLFVLLLLPGLDQSITAGSLKLFEFGVHDALGCGATLCLLFAHDRSRVAARMDAPVVAVLLLLVIATARDTSVTNFVRVLLNLIMDYGLAYYIVSRSIRTTDDLRLCLLHLAAAATILTAVLLYEARSSWPMYNMLYPHYGIMMELMVKARGGVLRAGGPFLESTSMAMALTSCILAAWLSRSAFRSTAHHLLLLGVLLLGLTAPQSRGAWIGLFLAMLVADVYRRRPWLAVRRVALIAGGGLMLVAVAPFSPYLSETLGLSGGSADTVDYRHRLLERGMEEFRQSPLVGYTPDDVTRRLADMRQGEGIIDFVNTYVYIGLHSGGIGLAIFLGTFLLYLLQLWRCRRRMARPGPDLDLFAFVFAGLVAPMEMLAFTSFGGRPAILVFVFFAFAAASDGIVRRAAIERRQIRGSRIAAAPPPTTTPTPPTAISASSSPIRNNPARFNCTQQ